MILSRGTALALLMVYCAYIVFQVSLFFEYFHWLVVTDTDLCSWKPMSTFMSQRMRCWRKRYQRWMLLPLHSRESSWTSSHHSISDRSLSVVYWVSLSLLRSVLIIVSTSFCWKGEIITEWLLLSVVASIEEFAERYSVPKPFIGLILLPIVVSECQVLFSQLPMQSRQMQLSMSHPYGWLWKIAWSLRSLSVLEAQLWVFFTQAHPSPTKN